MDVSVCRNSETTKRYGPAEDASSILVNDNIDKVSFVCAEQKIPDGTYQARWGGYLIKVPMGFGEFHLKTTTGIRTPNAPVWVKVRDGKINVFTRDE